MAVYWCDPWLKATNQGNGTTDTTTRNGTYAAPFALDDLSNSSTSTTATKITGVGTVTFASGDEIRFKGLDYDDLFNVDLGKFYWQQTYYLVPWKQTNGYYDDGNTYLWQNNVNLNIATFAIKPTDLVESNGARWHTNTSLNGGDIPFFTSGDGINFSTTGVRLYSWQGLSGTMGYVYGNNNNPSDNPKGVNYHPRLWQMNPNYYTQEKPVPGTGYYHHFFPIDNVTFTAGWDSETTQDGWTLIQGHSQGVGSSDFGGASTSTANALIFSDVVGSDLTGLSRMFFVLRRYRYMYWGYYNSTASPSFTIGGNGSDADYNYVGVNSKSVTTDTKYHFHTYFCKSTMYNYFNPLSTSTHPMEIEWDLACANSIRVYNYAYISSGTFANGDAKHCGNLYIGSSGNYNPGGTYFFNMIYGNRNHRQLGNVVFKSGAWFGCRYIPSGYINGEQLVLGSNSYGIHVPKIAPTVYQDTLHKVGTVGGPMEYNAYGQDSRLGPKYAISQNGDYPYSSTAYKLTGNQWYTVYLNFGDKATPQAMKVYSLGQLQCNGTNYQTTNHDIPLPVLTSMTNGYVSPELIAFDSNDYDGKPLISVFSDSGSQEHGFAWNDTVDNVDCLVVRPAYNATAYFHTFPMCLPVPTYTVGTDNLRVKVEVWKHANNPDQRFRLQAVYREPTRSGTYYLVGNYIPYSGAEYSGLGEVNVTSTNASSPTVGYFNISGIETTAGEEPITSITLHLAFYSRQSTETKYYLKNIEVETY